MGILWLILSSNLTPWCRPGLESSKYWSFCLSWLPCLHWERVLTFHVILASVLGVMFLIFWWVFFCLVHFFFNQGAGTDSAWETAFILYVFWNCINYSSCKELIEAFWFFAGESIPIRLFLAGYDPTPTMRDVNKKFSVRYFLNLVLVDEEDRRYFKQQVWSIVVLLQNCMRLWTFSRCFMCGASISAGSWCYLAEKEPQGVLDVIPARTRCSVP